MNRSPLHIILNETSTNSLVNSVDFHPTANRFCVTFTHNNRIVIYALSDTDQLSVFQILQNPSANLNNPQHAIFSKDGESIIVANWTNQTFSVYALHTDGNYLSVPIAIIPFFSPAGDLRPHGICFSPDGSLLAVAYGASIQNPRAIAFYQVSQLGTAETNLTLLHLLQGNEIETGIPKGITFSPDGSTLLVTFAKTNSIAHYSLDLAQHSIDSIPLQVLIGEETQLSRPEDIKFSSDGTYFAVSNSSNDTITFYPFDKKKNFIMSNSPFYTLHNPEGQLSFPHGLSFSSDGKYFAVTQFGPVIFNQTDHLISWGEGKKGLIAIYKL